MKLGSQLLPVHQFTRGRRLLTRYRVTFRTITRGVLEIQEKGLDEGEDERRVPRT